MRQLVWFRNDLRVADNPALTNAMAKGSSIALFILCEQQWREKHHCGDNKIDFIKRNVVALQQQLLQLNVPLVVLDVPLFADVPNALVQFCGQLNIEAVHCGEEYPVDERQRDQNCQTALQQRGVTFHSYCANLVFPPQQVVKDDGGHYQVFSAYRKKWLALLQHTEINPLSIPKPQQVIEDGFQSYSFSFAEAEPEQWPAGEQQAQQRLNDFIDSRILDYSQGRDFPAQQGTSKLSAYLAIGVLSQRQCIYAINCAPHTSQDNSFTWLSELIWREFYHAICLHAVRVCRYQPYIEKTSNVPWQQNPDHLRRWQQGLTGVPIVDAGMRQLLTEGWMHNRLRMIVAMYLSKNLLIDWRLGERWFMENLIDADFPANNGGWQWSASTGNDAAPYFRIFNPFSQSKRFDPDGDYIRRFVPELREVVASALHDPNKLAQQKPTSYPEPMVDVKASRQRAINTFKSALQDA